MKKKLPNQIILSATIESLLSQCEAVLITRHWKEGWWRASACVGSGYGEMEDTDIGEGRTPADAIDDLMREIIERMAPKAKKRRRKNTTNT